ncbi:DNA-3-methyladenine glycosylase family protein [Micromonospora auratinigra]|uniref:DNA-3-methyladenine glycosylase II n=1 Tax=Micromonospora auratinigra TaxID=261654 RepID=A0A1A8ZIA0_9ACTN|nr:DNA-3-methyladenine glycosylase [Micromonospora auratinigra]SBT43604.1 DNA-3-methyladenine glycosylase II [Micromonospora auratinigra]
MTRRTARRQVAGPWSLAISRQFWEGFAPAALPEHDDAGVLGSTFLTERDWTPATASVRQHRDTAEITVTGTGDLDAAVAQTARFLALDIDATGWPVVGERDAVIGAAQRQLPGLRPCGFHSPYEAACWAVLSQRIRIIQATGLRAELVRRHGRDGTFPAPARLRRLDLDLPGRKTEYLHAVADAALDGLLTGEHLRGLDADAAISAVQAVKGLGPFAAELVVLRGANHPDALPRHDKRLLAEVAERYGPQTTPDQVADGWRPYRTWAAVLLRALREQRTHEIGGSRRSG